MTITPERCADFLADFQKDKKVIFQEIQLTIVAIAHICVRGRVVPSERLNQFVSQDSRQFSAAEEASFASDYMIENFMIEAENNGSIVPDKESFFAWLSEASDIRKRAFSRKSLSNCIRFHTHAGLMKLKRHLKYFEKYLGVHECLTDVLREVIENEKLWE